MGDESFRLDRRPDDAENLARVRAVSDDTEQLSGRAGEIPTEWTAREPKRFHRGKLSAIEKTLDAVKNGSYDRCHAQT
jgi:hypothetical protein